MGSAQIQGQLWGARAQDWAKYVEQVCLPLFGATLDAARVTVGTRLLNAGCGAGLLALLASFRGGAGGRSGRIAGAAGHRTATATRG